MKNHLPIYHVRGADEYEKEVLNKTNKKIIHYDDDVCDEYIESMSGIEDLIVDTSCIPMLECYIDIEKYPTRLNIERNDKVVLCFDKTVAKIVKQLKLFYILIDHNSNNSPTFADIRSSGYDLTIKHPKDVYPLLQHVRSCIGPNYFKRKCSITETPFLEFKNSLSYNDIALSIAMKNIPNFEVLPIESLNAELERLRYSSLGLPPNCIEGSYYNMYSLMVYSNEKDVTIADNSGIFYIKSKKKPIIKTKEPVIVNWNGESSNKCDVMRIYGDLKYPEEWDAEIVISDVKRMGIKGYVPVNIFNMTFIKDRKLRIASYLPEEYDKLLSMSRHEIVCIKDDTHINLEKFDRVLLLSTNNNIAPSKKSIYVVDNGFVKEGFLNINFGPNIDKPNVIKHNFGIDRIERKSFDLVKDSVEVLNIDATYDTILKCILEGHLPIKHVDAYYPHPIPIYKDRDDIEKQVSNICMDENNKEVRTLMNDLYDHASILSSWENASLEFDATLQKE